MHRAGRRLDENHAYVLPVDGRESALQVWKEVAAKVFLDDIVDHALERVAIPRLEGGVVFFKPKDGFVVGDANDQTAAGAVEKAGDCLGDDFFQAAIDAVVGHVPAYGRFELNALSFPFRDQVGDDPPLLLFQEAQHAYILNIGAGEDTETQTDKPAKT